MASPYEGNIVKYLGHGNIASRPASLNLTPGAIGIWWADDISAASVWDGTGWNSLGGGSSSRNIVSAVTPSAGVATIDYSLGDYFTLAPTANVTSIVFSNLPSSPTAITLTIMFTQDSTPRTVAFPSSFIWEGGSPGAVSGGAGDIDLIVITSFDQGTTWFASIGNAWS